MRPRGSSLDRSAGWQPAAAATIVLFEPTDDPETPWLIELQPGSFVILSTSHEQQGTIIVPVHVAPEDAAPIQIGPVTRLDMADNEPQPEIEELPPAREWPRA